MYRFEIASMTSNAELWGKVGIASLARVSCARMKDLVIVFHASVPLWCCACHTEDKGRPKLLVLPNATGHLIRSGWRGIQPFELPARHSMIRQWKGCGVHTLLQQKQ